VYVWVCKFAQGFEESESRKVYRIATEAGIMRLFYDHPSKHYLSESDSPAEDSAKGD